MARPVVLSFGGGEMRSRFWVKVDVGEHDACWHWKGKPNAKGYGRFCFDHKVYIASRLAYEFINGPLDEGHYALHTCDNPICCNPRHLFAGTLIDNNADMRAKGRGHNPPAGINSGTFGHGRSSTGTHHPRAKLSSTDVNAIRGARGRGVPLRTLSATYGLSETQVSKVARGITYKETHHD